MNLREFFNSIIKNGGASFNITTGENNTNKGYMVSLPQYSETVPFSQFSERDVANFVNKNALKLSEEGMFLGGWIDNNTVYLSVSEQIMDKRIAIELGMRRNQLGIHDNINDVTIELPSNQTHGTMAQQRAYITSVVNRLCY